MSRNEVPQRGWKRVCARVVHRQRQALLVGVDRLVLGAVILEHAAHVGHQPDEAEVAEQDDHLDGAVHGVERHRAGVEAEQPGDEVRRTDEQRHAHRDGGDDHQDHGGLGQLGRRGGGLAGGRRGGGSSAAVLGLGLGLGGRSLGLGLAQHLLVGREAERRDAVDHGLEQRDPATQEGPLEEAQAAPHWLPGVFLDDDLAVGAPAHDRERAGRAHHDAFDHGLPAHVQLGAGRHQVQRLLSSRHRPRAWPPEPQSPRPSS